MAKSKFNEFIGTRGRESHAYLETNYLVHAMHIAHEFGVRGKFHGLPYLVVAASAVLRMTCVHFECR